MDKRGKWACAAPSHMGRVELGLESAFQTTGSFKRGPRDTSDPPQQGPFIPNQGGRLKPVERAAVERGGGPGF